MSIHDRRADYADHVAASRALTAWFGSQNIGQKQASGIMLETLSVVIACATPSEEAFEKTLEGSVEFIKKNARRHFKLKQKR